MLELAKNDDFSVNTEGD